MRLLHCSTAVPPLAASSDQVYLARIETHRTAVLQVEGSMHTHNVLGISFVLAVAILLGLAIAL